MQTIRDFMSETVWTIDSTAAVREAAQLMAKQNVGFLPVVHEGVTAGVITDRDIVVRVVAESGDPDQITVGAIVSHRRGMSAAERINSGVATLPEDTSIDEAVRYMDENRIRRVTVHDAEYRTIGVVSRVDLPDASAAVHES